MLRVKHFCRTLNIRAQNTIVHNLIRTGVSCALGATSNRTLFGYEPLQQVLRFPLPEGYSARLTLYLSSSLSGCCLGLLHHRPQLLPSYGGLTRRRLDDMEKVDGKQPGTCCMEPCF